MKEPKLVSQCFKTASCLQVLTISLSLSDRYKFSCFTKWQHFRLVLIQIQTVCRQRNKFSKSCSLVGKKHCGKRKKCLPLLPVTFWNILYHIHCGGNYSCDRHLTHYQTTNFRLFQTERLCRLQFQIWRKWLKVIQKGRKHCGKRRNCSLWAISPFPTVFSKGLFPRGVKRCHCVGKG